MLVFNGVTIRPLYALPKGKVITNDDAGYIYVSEEDWYRYIFSLAGLNADSIAYAQRHATNKVHNHIDYICTKYSSIIDQKIDSLLNS